MGCFDVVKSEVHTKCLSSPGKGSIMGEGQGARWGALMWSNLKSIKI